MIARPSNMSRRGFLRNVLGIGTAIILPSTEIVVPSLRDDFNSTLTKLLNSKEAMVKVSTAFAEYVRYQRYANSFMRLHIPLDPIPNGVL